MILNNGLFIQAFVWISLGLCGAVQYFTGVGAVLWLPFLLACTMVLLLIMQTRFRPFSLDAKEQCIFVLLIGLIAIAVISTLLQSGVIVTIVGMKNEIGLVLITLCLALGFCQESQLYRGIKALYGVFYLQFPVILYQILVIVPQRVAMKGDFEKWDSVVGTFGGDPMGGGNSAALGLFCLLIMLLKLSEFKHGVASRTNTLLHIVAAFAVCVLGEIKFVILLSPVLMVYVWFSPSYVKGMKKFSFKMLLIISLGMLLLVGLAIFALASSYSAALGTDPSKGVLEVFIESLSYIFDPNAVLENGELGRLTTIFFWLENSGLYGLPSELFGYGLNATNHGSSVAPGFLNIVFNVLLDSTSLSMMLWELGIIGTLLLVLSFIGIIVVARPKPVLDRSSLDSRDMRLVSSQPAFIAFAIAGLLSLPYSQLLMLIPTLQFQFYFVLGALLVNRHAILANRHALAERVTS